MESNHIGQRLSFDGALCTVRYIGSIIGTQKEWLGVEWDDITRGKHDGEHNETRYFSCRSRSKTSASFIRPSRNPDPTQSFVQAVHLKYATETTERRDALAMDLEKEIEISGKTVYEVGFDKIRMQLRQLNELKIVLVDGMRVNTASTPDKRIIDVCPKIVELDISRNLFENCIAITEICDDLQNVKTLILNGNRMTITQEDLQTAKAKVKFAGIQTLGLDDMLVTWDDVCLLGSHFERLVALSVSRNELPMLPPTSTLGTSLAGLTSLTLEHNEFTSIEDISTLAQLPNLQKLYLKGNQIASVSNTNTTPVVFGMHLTEVDLSYNAVTAWSFVDALADVFPGMVSFRFSHNPIYTNVAALGSGAVSADETYMLTLARLARLTTLNFSGITSAERTNAEMFYLSRIGKAIAAVSKGQESSITVQHRRYAELCELYGEPVIVRTGEIVNPNFLEARLIKFSFSYRAREHEESIQKIQEIPKGYDIYQIKGIVGKLFDVRPLRIKLIWETGEWDPVAGYENDEDTDGEDENYQPSTIASEETQTGKFMRREVELEDGTRQIGNTIDATEANVRVELR